MENNAKIILRCLVACLAIACGTQESDAQSIPTSSQQFDDQWWHDFHLVETLFKQRGLIPYTDSRRAFRSSPRETVLVVVGSKQSVDFFEISRFVKRGGAVVFATDQTTTLKDFGFIQQGPLRAATPDEAYLGFDDCLRVKDLDQDHPLNRGVQELIANRTGYLYRLSGFDMEWDPIASVPKTRNRSQESQLIAVGQHRSSEGKIVVLADHSLLTNGMLWHGDNAIFAVNLVQWISAGKKRFLLLSEDRIGSSPLPPPELPTNLPPPPVEDLPELTREQMVTFANQLVTGLEDADVFNELATNRLPFLSDSIYKRSILLAFAALLILLLLYRFVKSRYAPVPAFPEREMSNLAKLRVTQTMDSGHYQFAAKQLAQDFFKKITGSSQPQSWSLRSKDIQIQCAIIFRPFVRRKLTQALQFANSDQWLVNKAEFRLLTKTIRSLDRRWQNGQLRHPNIIRP